MAQGATTDPRNVKFFINGAPVGGRSKGEFLAVSYTVQQFSMTIGVDGEGFWNAVPDLSAMITVTLLQSSQSNDYLSALWNAQINAPGGLLWPVRVTEENGTTRFGPANGCVVGLSPTGWADTGSTRVWAIGTTYLPGFVGGLPTTPIGSLAAS